MDKKAWINPEITELNINQTEAGNGTPTVPDLVRNDGTYTWYSFPSGN